MSLESSTARSYRHVRTIAAGGMGRVDLVVRREGAFARAYVQKRLHDHLADDGEVRSMFLEEARIAGLIRHANVVSVLDVGEDEEGSFLVMDYVEGIPVTTLVSAAVSRGELLPVEVCVEIAMQAARGLQAAAEVVGAGGKPSPVVHRDVTPSNILVGFDGVVRVTDFGIARALDRSSHTRVGVIKGKPGYLTPEQLRHEAVDGRADIFSLGVVLYEMLSGARLYRGERDEVHARILTEPPPDVGERRRDVPPELAGLLFEMLAKDREDRPRGAATVAARLADVWAGIFGGGDHVDLRDYLSEHHAAERDTQRELVRVALEDHDETVLVESPPEPDEGASREAPTSILDGPPRRSWVVPAAVTAGIVVLASVAVAAIASTSGDPEPPPEGADQVEERREPVATDRRGEVGEAAAETTSPPVEVDAFDDTTEEAAPPAMRSRPAMRRGPMETTPDPERDDERPPSWDWD
jgi:serine/threonine-protein kinase